MTHTDEPGSDDVEIEVILQRVFNEKDPVAHRTAIWELLGRSEDWESFERVSEVGGRKGIETYFHSVLDNFDEATDVFGFASEEQRNGIRELYAAPLVCLHNSDWAGSAAAIHEILLNEIYEVFSVDEKQVPYGEATAFELKRWVGAEVLFPLSVIEYMAFSNYLTETIHLEVLESSLALMLTLYFSAQAHLDLRQKTAEEDDLEISPGDDA